VNSSINVLQSDYEPLKQVLLEEEAAFYNDYCPWAFNAFPTVRNSLNRLRQELAKLDHAGIAWQREEALRNIFLLSCSVSDVVDDFLIGSVHDFSKVSNVFPVFNLPIGVLHKSLAFRRKLRNWNLTHIHQWRSGWRSVVIDFLREFVAENRNPNPALPELRERFIRLISAKLPNEFLESWTRNPAAFRTQDLSAADTLRLGDKFVAMFPDRERPILVVGSRTAGSYFAPLLHAYLANLGYRDVASMTLRPKKDASPSEQSEIRTAAMKNALALVTDEAPKSGSALLKCVNILEKYGTKRKSVVSLFPVHRSNRQWRDNELFMAMGEIPMLALEPEEYEKYRLMDSCIVEARLREYFQSRGWQDVKIVPSIAAEEFSAQVESTSEKKFHARMKRCYEIHLRDSAGNTEQRYVLAKSVGWGWLSYHAFLSGERLEGSVPSIIGLRDGILYSEFIPGGNRNAYLADRSQLTRLIASYVAKRVETLRMPDDSTRKMCAGTGHNGFEHLADVLSRAYGYKATAGLKRNRILTDLGKLSNPHPTLIDSRMRLLEWVDNGSSLIKTDYEQHGQGKICLNITDPAYDLADATLHFQLSEAEENEMLEIYASQSGDSQIKQRIFLYKLLAGTFNMANAVLNLEDPILASRHQEFNQDYLNAWNFSMIQTARFSATLSKRPTERSWRSPLIFLDVDGVVDKQIFGFPSNTSAGIRAIGLLNAHNFPVALNTARSPMEVQEYCRAYGFLGGIGEYGAYAWDGITGRERVLISEECRDEIERLREALSNIPGVFLNDCYKYSIKAFTYSGGRTIPLPKLMVSELMDRLGVKRLSVRPTFTDTCIISKEVDKGTGMKALLDLAGLENAETIAIGDTEPDLAAFRVATRSFAPSNCTCRPVARSLGCKIVAGSYEKGLLEIVRQILHPDGQECEKCRLEETAQGEWDQLFLNLLTVSDQSWPKLLVRSMLHPQILDSFAQ
jgi:hydroxymethylpyrimidine pyrophosphatase-like HAD family hydrolase